MESHHIVASYLPDESATLTAGTRFARAIGIDRGLVITLVGELGTGKTTFTRGVLAGFGYQGKVKSPTYTLIESYSLATVTLHHVDLYRFVDPQEWEDTGFRDNFRNDTLWLIEWPSKAAGLLPLADITLELTTHRQGRHALFRATTTAGQLCLNRLSTLADVAC